MARGKLYNAQIMEALLYLYPIDEYIDWSLKLMCFSRIVNEGLPSLREKYAAVLNETIDCRYRQNGYQVNFAIFNDKKLSQLVDIQPNDKVLPVGMDFATHTTKRPDGTYPYPDINYLLNQLGDFSKLRVTGFHIGDCVQRVASSALKCRLNVAIDADLTEFLPDFMFSRDFVIDQGLIFRPEDRYNIATQLLLRHQHPAFQSFSVK
jgi:hypothetical protein